MDLSVIILSYNTKDITNECLKRLQLSVNSCQEKLKNKIQVIVLDNASSDGSVEMIKSRHSWVELIESRENTGYSKGNNLAMKQCNNPLILFLNSDVYVEKDTLEKALEYFNYHNCDVLGVKLTFEDGKFQPSGGNLPNPINTVLWILGLGELVNPFHPKSKEYFSKTKEVGWTMGAFFMIKEQVFASVGGFDESIFMYMDEVDLCKRLALKGFKVCFNPFISVIHLHRASSGDLPQIAFTNELKGIRIYFKKYYASSYPIVKLFLIFGLILRIIAFSLLGSPARAKAYIKGLSVI